MGSQSWKAIVEAVAGPEPLPVVYDFTSHRGDFAESRPLVVRAVNLQKLPEGIFVEYPNHGAYSDD